MAADTHSCQDGEDFMSIENEPLAHKAVLEVDRGLLEDATRKLDVHVSELSH